MAAKKGKSGPSWIDVKKAIEAHGSDEAIKLVSDLSRLSKANQTFLHTRYSLGEDPLKPYKRIISDSVYPDVLEDRGVRIQISRARRAVADYKKAVGDVQGEAELMVYFVEQGTAFTADIGDIDEDFYDAMESMYGRAIKNVKKLPEKAQAPFVQRLRAVVVPAAKVGWSYSENLTEMFNEAFGKS